MDKNIKNYIGKSVITLNGENVGIIANVTMDKKYKSIKNFVIYGNEEEELLLPIKALHMSGNDAVIVRKILTAKSQGVSSPLGLNTYDISGNYLGTIGDIVLDDNMKDVVKIVASDKEIMTEDIFAVDSCVLANIEKLDVKRPKRQPRVMEFTAEKVEATNEVAPQKMALVKEVREQATQPIATSTNKKTLSGEKMLIGRKAKRDIILEDGSKLITRGQIITQSVVEMASRKGKLYELTISSLSNIL